MSTSELPEITRKGAYGIAIFEGFILLVRQMKGPLKDLLDLPGGGIEGEETPEDALKREFLEEVGGHFDKFSLLETISQTHFFTEMVYHLTAYIYGVSGFAHTLLESSPPELSFDWYPIKDLDSLPLTPVAKLALSKAVNL